MYIMLYFYDLDNFRNPICIFYAFLYGVMLIFGVFHVCLNAQRCQKQLWER